jgi:hypothetical protein
MQADNLKCYECVLDQDTLTPISMVEIPPGGRIGEPL